MLDRIEAHCARLIRSGIKIGVEQAALGDQLDVAVRPMTGARADRPQHPDRGPPAAPRHSDRFQGAPRAGGIDRRELGPKAALSLARADIPSAFGSKLVLEISHV